MNEIDQMREKAKELCLKAATVAERCNLENMQDRFNLVKVLEGDRWTEGESAIALFDKSGVTIIHVTPEGQRLR